MGADSVNPLFTEFTTAKLVWLVVIAACTAVVVIRGIRRKRRQKDRDCGPDVDKSS